MITLNTWKIWPELRLARNTHNGAFTELDPSGDNDWQLSCNGCPAQWAERYHNNNYDYVIIRSIV